MNSSMQVGPSFKAGSIDARLVTHLDKSGKPVLFNLGPRYIPDKVDSFVKRAFVDLAGGVNNKAAITNPKKN